MPETTSKVYLCNLCGESCQLGAAPCNPNGLLLAKVWGTYYSTPGNGNGALDDDTSYHFSLCEFCLDWLFGKFKIPVKEFDLTISQDTSNGFKTVEEPSNSSWKPAAQKVKEETWREMKDEFFAEYEKRNKARGLE